MKQLADLFNLSFMTGVFPSVLKTAKALDDGNTGYGVFVDLQKAFDHYQNLITMGFVEFQMIGLNPICLIAISMYL